jgi:two-component system nitrogen regulation response regulator NtrX
LIETDKSGYILVVDDDESICDVVAAVLRDEGYEVVCVRSVESALQVVNGRQPRLMLLDLSVANQGGAALVASYRLMENGPGHIIVMSGHVHGEQEASALGADGFLEKPFDILVLLEVVEQAFNPRGV